MSAKVINLAEYRLRRTLRNAIARAEHEIERDLLVIPMTVEEPARPKGPDYVGWKQKPLRAPPLTLESLHRLQAERIAETIRSKPPKGEGPNAA